MADRRFFRFFHLLFFPEPRGYIVLLVPDDILIHYFLPVIFGVIMTDVLSLITFRKKIYENDFELNQDKKCPESPNKKERFLAPTEMNI